MVDIKLIDNMTVNPTSPYSDTAHPGGDRDSPLVGSSFLLSGSGFGTRPSQAQQFFDDFEGSALGAYVQVGNSDYIDGGIASDRYATYSDEVRHSNATRSAAMHHTNDGNGNVVSPHLITRAIDGVDVTGDLFLHWRMKHRWPDPTGANLQDGRTGYQVKVAVASHDIPANGNFGTNLTSEYHEWLYSNDLGASQYTKCDYRNVQNDNEDSSSLYYPNNTVPANHDGWLHHYEMIRHGTAGIADGAIEGNIGLNGSYVKAGDISVLNRKIRDDSLKYMNQMKFLWYLALLKSYDITYYFDEICIDNSFMQVWLADATTKEAATNKELQKIVSWGDGAIEIVRRLGSFASISGLNYLVQGIDGSITHVIPASAAVEV